MEGKIPDRILNIGTGVESTTLQLAEQIGKALGSRSEILFGECRAGDVERSLLDADRLVELLGPTVPVAAGVRQTSEWFRDRAAKAVAKH